jgi:hypothetical protein
MNKLLTILTVLFFIQSSVVYSQTFNDSVDKISYDKNNKSEWDNIILAGTI